MTFRASLEQDHQEPDRAGPAEGNKVRNDDNGAWIAHHSTIASVVSGVLVVHSDLPPGTVLARIEAAIDAPKPDPFALSHYAGRRQILGTVTPPEFRVWRLHIVNQSFHPEMRGVVFADANGSRIEVHFGMREAGRYLATGLLLFSALVWPVLMIFELAKGASVEIIAGFLGMMVVSPIITWGYVSFIRFVVFCRDEEVLAAFLEMQVKNHNAR